MLDYRPFQVPLSKPDGEKVKLLTALKLAKNNPKKHVKIGSFCR